MQHPLQPQPDPSGTTPEERNMALIAHLAPLAGYFVAIGQIAIPLIIMFTTQSQYVRSQAVESLNAQISFTIAALVCVPLMFVLIGIPLLLAVGIYATVTMILAAIAASKGERYYYPYILRLVS